jgi:transposase
VAASERPIEIVGERRRAYDLEFRSRLVEASRAPGACVRDLAQRHGVCVSLIYRWRRSVAPRARSPGSGHPGMDAPASNLAMAGEGPLEFVPLGVFGRAEDKGPPSTGIPLAKATGTLASSALVTGPAVGRPGAPAPMPSPSTAMQARPGLIEIDLPDGTRLRVDAFVNERALRRVLAVLRATA